MTTSKCATGCGQPAGDDGRTMASGAVVCRQCCGRECCRCGKLGSDRYSLGLPAGRYCDSCWRTAGYRDEPASAFDPMDAGESYDEDGGEF